MRTHTSTNCDRVFKIFSRVMLVLGALMHRRCVWREEHSWLASVAIASTKRVAANLSLPNGWGPPAPAFSV